MLCLVPDQFSFRGEGNPLRKIRQTGDVKGDAGRAQLAPNKICFPELILPAAT